MKKQILIPFFLGMVLWFTPLAQGQPGQVEGLPGAIVFRSPEGVYIRWTGFTGEDFDGYNLYRQVDGGDWLRVNDALLSIELSWETVVARAGRFQGAIYLSLFGVTDEPRDISLQERSALLSLDEGAGFLGLMSVSQPIIGELLGETFLDQTVPAGSSTLQYRITVVQNGTESPHSMTRQFEAGIFDEVPLVDSLEGFPRDRAAMLVWHKNREHLLSGEVTSYRLYRASSPIGPFVQVNVENIMPLGISSGEMADDPDKQTYIDRFLENERAYYYHVRGLNSFGLEGDPGEVITVIPGHPDPPPAPFDLDGEVFGASVRLRWDYRADDQIQGFEVYRSEVRDGIYEKVFPLTDLQLQPGMRQWIDLNAVPGGDTYYYLHAVGKNGLLSNASDTLVFHYLDVVAPAPPQNVVAVSDTARIIISWSSNTEPDLLGYEIEKASDASLRGRFLLGLDDGEGGTTTLIPDTFYIDVVPIYSHTTHGYVVYALDRAMNRSRPSEMVTARVVDITPPSAPLIYELSHSNQEVFLRWSANPESDLAGYRVYRALGDSTNLEMQWEGEMTSLTESVADEGTYFYQVTAVDEADNESLPSQMVWLNVQAGPPLPPASGEAVWDGNRVVVSWEPSPSANTAGYFLQRLHTETGRRIDLVELDIDATEFVDRYAPRDQEIIYLIHARDARWRLSDALEVVVEE